MTDFEERFQKIEERIAKIEQFLFTGGSRPKSKGIEKLLIDNVDDISTQHLVVIALFLKPKQTKQEIKKMLEDWGKAVGNWFQGGNMNNRLLKKGVIKKDGANDKNEDLFSLTGKGGKMAEEFIEKITIPNK
ncbi:MAG: hypothetical protein ABI340_06525 [Nitrososphaera sp.]